MFWLQGAIQILYGSLRGQKEVLTAPLQWMPISYQSTANMCLDWGYGCGHNQSMKPSKEIYIVVRIQLPNASYETEDTGGTDLKTVLLQI